MLRPLFLFAALLLGGCVTFGAPPAETPPQTAQPAPQPACSAAMPSRVLVTAFPLRYPEQVRSGEFIGWPQVTADTLAQRLERDGRLHAIAAPERFPFDDVEQAPAVEQRDGKPLVAAWAAQAHAQYVVAGVFRDIGATRKWLVVPQRQMSIEAYLYDGLDGALLARREFARTVEFSGALPKSIAPGTRAFDTSRFGAGYAALLGDIARWTEDTLACLPTAIRVVRVEDRLLHLDGGQDRGLAPGMALSLARPGGAPRKGAATAYIKSVGATNSVAEIPRQFHPPVVRAGDILYLI